SLKGSRDFCFDCLFRTEPGSPRHLQERKELMMSRRTKLCRCMALFAVLLLVHIATAQQVVLALTSPAYQGTSIPGRVSWITVRCPGDVRVNTFLGNMVYPRLDLRIPGLGLPLEVALTFNADSANTDTGFGKGWRCDYQISARRKADDTIVINWGDGRRDP